jgi:hypothetical protein
MFCLAVTFCLDFKDVRNSGFDIRHFLLQSDSFREKVISMKEADNERTNQR